MKDDSYLTGFNDGIDFANRIVKGKGPEELEREAKFRNSTGIKVPVSYRILDKDCEKIKNHLMDTMLIMTCSVLHDEFGFGEKRIKQFADRFMLKTECLVRDIVDWETLIDILKEETKIELSIRRND